jgi:hypothetical protein
MHLYVRVRECDSKERCNMPPPPLTHTHIFEQLSATKKPSYKQKLVLQKQLRTEEYFQRR